MLTETKHCIVTEEELCEKLDSCWEVTDTPITDGKYVLKRTQAICADCKKRVHPTRIYKLWGRWVCATCYNRH